MNSAPPPEGVTTPPTLTYASERLIREWRDRYTGRRTVAWQMLHDAEVLVRDAIVREREQEQRQAKTEREWELERRERRVENAERLHEQQLDRLRLKLAEAEAKVESLSTRRTLMREERETVEQGTVVRLLAPTEPLSWTTDKSQVRPWMLGELEDVLHRLRMGGGDEGTEVRFKRDAIEACIPFAEFALVQPPPRKETVSTESATSKRPEWPVIVGLVAIVAFVVLMLAVAA